MQPKFTQSNLWSFWKKMFVIVLVLTSVTKYSYSQIDLFNEGFATVLPPGWAEQNLSNPIGAFPTWVQGDDALFPAHTGGPGEYILGNYQNVGPSGNLISNWLFCPTVLLTNGDVFSFWTRTVDAPAFPDRLQVRLSTNGASVNVGTTDVSVGDYATLLLDINPTYDVNGFPNVWTLQTITISGLAAPTQGRIAFRYFVEDGGPNGNNSDNVGIDDVEYFQTVSPACSTPTPGNTVASVTTICPNFPFNLTVENATPGLGVSYQWQSAPDISGPYTDIPGATNNSLTTTLTASTSYQLVVTCSGTPVASTPVTVLLTPPSGCYCVPGAQDCTLDDVITNVTFGGIDNTTDCSPIGYTNYGALPPATAQAGAPNPMSVTVGPGGNEFVAVWIDYNHNGQWEANEYTALGNGNGSTITGNVNIPASALPGVTGMRVRVRYNVLQPANSSCSTLVFGETEDYNVDISPCVQGGITTQPSDASAVCGTQASFTVATNGTAITYQWEERASASSPWNNLVDGGIYSGATAATLNLNGVTDAMNGYQYRVVIAGGCTAFDFSDVVNLTVDPLTVVVDPVSVDVCALTATVVPLQITSINPVGGSVTETVSFPSGAVNIPIPDGDNAGITSPVAVAVPAGSVISAASVKLNISHTWIGDCVVALKAPNGNVLNLDYGLTQTGGSGATTGFTNTVISSAAPASATLVSGSDPWTGTFAPDAPTAPGTVPTAPTSLSATNANVFTFAGLYSVPSGNWTLGVLDFAAPDNGTLIDWELTLTYTYAIGVPYNGIWTPAAGLFSDAAGTVPYVAGTETNIVYTLPTSTTAYSVTPVTAICTGAPVTIPINVSNPVGALTAPDDAAVCPGDAASFTASAASGNDISYQWQVSTDGGANFTDISNGSVYNGATTATLTLTNIPASYNNNQYRAVLSVSLCSSSATTDAATLTVNTAPIVTIAAAPYTSLIPGLVTVLSATPNDLASYQWFLNGVAIPGATSATYNADIDGLGVYTVEATSNTSCPAVSNASLTIRDSATTTLFIYPNPNNGVFQVRYNNGANDLQAKPRVLSIYDSKGARVYSKTFTVTIPFGRMDVDLSRQPKGVYVIDLTDSEGKRLQSERVVIR